MNTQEKCNIYWNIKRFSMLNISQVILVRTDSNLCWKELTVHWSAPNSLIRFCLQPCTNSMLGDESEAVAPIVWLYQTVDARKEAVFFPDLLITLRRYVKASLFQAMARCRQVTNHNLRRWWMSSMRSYGFTMEQCVEIHWNLFPSNFQRMNTFLKQSAGPLSLITLHHK